MSRRAETLGGNARKSALPGGGGPRAHSIAWPIFALVIASVVLGTTVVFFVTFNGPPPGNIRSREAAVATMLRTGKPPSDPGGRMLAFRTDEALPAPDQPFRPDPAARRTLSRLLDVPLDQVVAWSMRPDPDRSGFGRDFILAWHPNGRGPWRIVETPRPLLAPWHLKTLTAMLLAILALALPAWIIARAISRPVRAVARAAREARAGAALPPLPVGGSSEVRDLSRAVAAMHARLAAHAEGRTTMLAAIAHDLGTPLSRLAFRVEQLPDAARERAAADIAEMRAMIAAALSFARDENADMSARIELGSLLDSLVEDMREAGAVTLRDAGPRAVVRGDSGSLRRLFANLVENAIRYGDRAEIGWRIVGREVEVTIDDHGPGVDPATVERLFEPFVRGDPSRNRATGGTGLGLAIVRSIAARHSGEVVLGNGATGAQARVTLPLA
ncbi:ATP-binding protein [Sphingomonas sp. KR1UV-12]|uniref:histidine kinase n=1 Tax=Sphingomonas aurea TaxID=3063994 RepID=A0ABT9EI97_9SPHN|nr:ATP-binding protein [Sphingomonas sp. KR1UV-12]MDP1026679.1 ATP-binding protein [Sphingomonas sp. KR1UV-12]